MPNIDILILAIVQGITEFLPISSSGHLILVPKLFCWPDQGLTLDVAAHVGTLVAVLVYFWRDVANMGAGLIKLARGKRDNRARLVWLLLVASVPALAIGFVLMMSRPASAQVPDSPRGDTVDLEINVAPCVAHLETRLREIIAIELRTSARVDEHASRARFHAWVRCVRGGVLL